MTRDPDLYDCGTPLTPEEEAALEDEMLRLAAEDAMQALEERDRWHFWFSEEGQERLRRLDAAIEWGGL